MHGIRECNNDKCNWVGWSRDCVSPKHGKSMMLCPDCYETTFRITPELVKEMQLKLLANGLDVYD